MRIAVLATAVSTALVGLSLADPAAAAIKAPTNITPQELKSALRVLAADRHLQILYTTETVGDRQTAGAVGEFTVEEALTRLLGGTELMFRYIDDSTITIMPRAGNEVTREPAAAPGSEAPEREEAQSFWSRLRLAQAETPAAASTDKKVELQEVVLTVPEVLIKGSRSLNMDIERSPDDIQPYVVFDRRQLEQAGAGNIEEFLRQRLSMNAQTTSLAQTPSQVGNASSINLRGLGMNQTLILVDGHRRASFGASGVPQQPDLNGIPISAIERIEVLPTTASGIYGGGATGGVINIVLRRDYTGVETKLTYENAFDSGGANRRVDLSAGYTSTSGRTNVLFAGSYTDGGSLPAGDRDFLQDGRDRILAKNPAFFFGSPNPPLGRTTNIRSTSGANLLLKTGGQLSSPITYVPEGYSGAASDLGAALAANAGRYNLALADTAQPSGGGAGGLLNSPTIEAFTTTIRQEITPSVKAFLELGASNNTGYFRTSNAASTFVIPRASAINPFDQDIRVTTPAFGGDGFIVASNHVRRAVGGAIFDLPGDWHSSVDYTFERTRFTSSTPGALVPSASTAVSNGTLNVLRDTNSFPVDFSSFLNPPTSQSPVHTTLKDAAVRFAGPIFSLPGGAPTLSTLLEHREEILGDQTSFTGGPVQTVTLNPGKEQTVDSVYLELRVPLVSAANAMAGVRELELQLAGRHDRYETEGASASGTVVTRATNRVDSTDPTVGLRYAPIEDVAFRASYGTGFVPPGVTDLVPSAPSSLPGNLLGLTDPRRGGEPVAGTVTLQSGGNPDLTPEESKSHSFGIVLKPRFASGLRVSLDWTRIEKSNEITNIPISQSALNSESTLPEGIITRAAPAAGDPFGVGKITGWRTSRLNIARKSVEALDLSLDYAYETAGIGTFEFYSNATRQMHFEVQTVSGAPVEERTGLITALKWRAAAGLSWMYQSWTLGWNARYLDSYWANIAHTTVIPQGAPDVSSQTYHDVFVNWKAPGSLDGSLLAGTEVQFGVKNVFDRDPPFDATNVAGVGGNLYSPLADPRLRTYLISLKKAF